MSLKIIGEKVYEPFIYVYPLFNQVILQIKKTNVLKLCVKALHELHLWSTTRVTNTRLR